MEFSIHIEGLENATAAVREGVLAGIGRGIERAGLRGEELVREMIEHPPFGKPVIATGIFHSTVTSEFQQEHGIIGRAVVFAQPPGGDYADYVEAGTGPHMPPVKALLLWVKRKFPVEASNEKAALRIAWAVAKSIARRGTLGRGMFHYAFEKLFGELQGILVRGVGEELAARGLG